VYLSSLILMSRLRRESDTTISSSSSLSLYLCIFEDDIVRIYLLVLCIYILARRVTREREREVIC
jgi:hypothetical protein